MCGIAGIIGLQSLQTVERLIRSISHRGPDETSRQVVLGSYVCAACRLRIVDVDHNVQPFLDKPLGFCVTFNGEIYNYRSLRKRLEALGHQFETKGDVEVLANAYKEWGIDFVDELRGMFAIAVYDHRIQALFLIRDRLGVKPLYFVHSTDLVAFASEMKAFFSAGIATSEIDEDYLLYRSVFDFGPADRTLFAQIQTVEPGSVITVRGGFVSKRKYYTRKLTDATNRNKELEPMSSHCTRISEVLTKSVDQMIPSEVPWGIFLSGGVDSSILAAIATRKLRLNPLLITLRDENSSEDFHQAEAIASFLGTQLTEVRVESVDMVELLPSYVLAIEDFDPLSFYWYALSRKLSGRIKVGLCGHGADELFAGYPFYHDGFVSLVDRYRRKFETLKTYATEDTRLHITELVNRLRSDQGRSFLYDFFLSDQLVGFQLLPLDKCTMSHGLEVRVPYLDETVVEEVSSISLDLKLNLGIEKQLLRDSFAGFGLPNIQRRKRFSGEATLPAYYAKIRALANDMVSDEHWRNHKYSGFFGDKLQMLCFDLLMHMVTECDGTVPKDMNLKELFSS